MIKDNELFAEAQGLLMPSLVRAGFACSEERYDKQSFGSQYSLFRSPFTQVRLIWDGKDRWLTLQCDRLPGENRPRPWLQLCVAKLQELEHSDELIAQVPRDFEVALGDYLEKWKLSH